MIPEKRAPVPMAPAGAGAAEGAAVVSSVAPGDGAGEMVPVRIISASHGHRVDAIMRIAAAELDDAVAAGWADPNPASIAEAERLNALHEAHKDLDKRLGL